MSTLVVNVHEETVVATANVVRSYLNALMEGFLAMELEGNMMDYMVQADPEKYAKYIRLVYDKKVLYLRIVNFYTGVSSQDCYGTSCFGDTKYAWFHPESIRLVYYQ